MNWKETIYKLAHSIPLQTQEYFDAKHKFEKETNELIEGFANLEKSCSGCVYEDADGSTAAISNCVCCSRNVDFAKNDYYRKK